MRVLNTHRAMASLLIAVALGTTGCATPRSTTSEPGASATPRVDSAMTRLSSLDISEIANIVMVDAETLASTSDAVIVGTLRQWLVGDKVTTKSGAGVGAAILAEVEIEDVAQLSEGTRLSPGETIYLTLISGTMETEKIVDALPAELQIAAYLEGPLSGDQLDVNDALSVEAGDARAAGLPRWVPEPQGLVVVDPDDPHQLLWPMLGSRQEGTLDDALPGGALSGQ
ncbi:hypothetical protein [Microbacterium sp.]|uniref:hypothetical protein n=1 Tax=Microbacterium sp. TaxID=51671 RepID=UPI0039E2A83D